MINFYENVIKSLGLKTQEGFIFKNSGEEWSHRDIPIVLPTDENINNTTETTKDGKVKTVKILFNPANESNEITTSSSIIIALNNLITYNIIIRFLTIGEVLTNIYLDKNIHQSLKGSIVKFIGNTYKINKKTFDNISKEIFKITKTENIFNINLKKRYLHKEVTYKRGLRLETNFKLLTLSENESKYLEGLSEFIIGDTPIVITSNSICPAFTCLMTLHSQVIENTNNIIQDILKLSNDFLNSNDRSKLENLLLDINVDLSDSNLESIRSKSSLIPTEDVVTRASINKQSGIKTTHGDFNKPLNVNEANIIKEYNKVQPKQENDEDLIARITGISSNGQPTNTMFNPNVSPQFAWSNPQPNMGYQNNWNNPLGQSPMNDVPPWIG